MSESMPVAEPQLEGVWELVSYEVAAQPLEVSGLLLMQNGYFAMDYTMQAPDGMLSARSHSGNYHVESGKLLFDVRHWIESVEGVSRIVTSAPHASKMELVGVDLRLEFTSGSVQHWHRLLPEIQPPAH